MPENTQNNEQLGTVVIQNYKDYNITKVEL